MEKDDKTTLKGKISTKKEAKETIDKFKSVSGEWEINLKTDEMTANFKKEKVCQKVDWLLLIRNGLLIW